MKCFYAIISVLVLYSLYEPSSSDNVVDIVTRFKYPIEVHADVVTKDGYIITMHRIPHGINASKSDRGPPILLLHSIFDSGDGFVFLEPAKSLGYLLADRGYDVWIMNARSTSYSRRHVTLDPDRDNEFWNFTLTELASDVSGSIDYIIDETRYEKIFVLGYSQGATLCAILCTEFPEYNNKIELLIAFSPAIFLENPFSSLVMALIRYMDTLKYVLELTNTLELHPGRSYNRNVGTYVCSTGIGSAMCKNYIQSITGWNPDQLDEKYLSSIVKNSPEGVGLYQLLHYLQLHKTDNFQKYDYGSSEQNFAKYGTEHAPIFDLSKVVVPTAIYYSEQDSFINMTGVIKFSKVLPNVVDLHMVDNKVFTHTDFILAKDAVTLLYNRVFELLDRHKMLHGVNIINT